MPKTLSPSRVADYRRDGFLFPVPGITRAAVADYRNALETYERGEGASIGSMSTRYKSHTLFPWANRLGREAALLDAGEDLIRPDILVWASTVFIKEPRNPSITAGHQDLTVLRPR